MHSLTPQSGRCGLLSRRPIPNSRLRCCVLPVRLGRRESRIYAARSSGREEREQALRQESSPEEQQSQWEGGPYDRNPYGGPPQYFQQYPGYPGYGTPPPEPSGGVPWGWVLIGGVVAIVVSKVVEFFSPTGGGPQGKIMNFMMKQAMKGAGSGSGKDMPAGFPDFSKLGAAPGMPGSFPGSGFPSSSGSSPRAGSQVVDTQARTIEQDTGTSPSSTSQASPEATRPGAKFEELKAQGRRRRRGQESSAPSTAAAFQDVDEEDKASTSTGAAGTEAASPVGEGEDVATMEMLEQFMQDPNMQQLLYQYLPEPMRNKETFDWMLKNPEYRAQLQSMMKAQGAQLNPEVYKQMQGFDSDEVKRQLEQHGMTPSDVVRKVMGEPDLAAAFTKPQVQQAILELQNNPMALLKYQDDPDVMLVFEKMSQMFPQVDAGSGEGINPAEVNMS